MNFFDETNTREVLLEALKDFDVTGHGCLLAHEKALLLFTIDKEVFKDITKEIPHSRGKQIAAVHMKAFQMIASDLLESSTDPDESANHLKEFVDHISGRVKELNSIKAQFEELKKGGVPQSKDDKLKVIHTLLKAIEGAMKK